MLLYAASPSKRPTDTPPGMRERRASRPHMTSPSERRPSHHGGASGAHGGVSGARGAHGGAHVHHETPSAVTARDRQRGHHAVTALTPGISRVEPSMCHYCLVALTTACVWSRYTR